MLALFAALAASIARPRIPLTSTKKYFSAPKVTFNGCDMCENIAVGILDMKQSGISIDDAKVELLDHCGMFSDFEPAYEEKCEEIARYYIPLFYNIVDKHLTETQICTKLGYCSDLESSKKK